MPSLVKVRVERAVDLPVMDSNDGSTDAFVLIKLNDQSFQTSTYRKSLSPVWNEDFIFEVADDSSLQDAPLEFKVMDQGFSASELIGVIYVDMNPLIMRTATDTSSDKASSKDLVIQGYFPLFDVSNIKGVRGALKLVIKLQFIGNDNPFRDSSAGVQFFSASLLSDTSFVVQEVLGFVADLVVEDDPETSWQDYFRKAGKSANDNRLKVLYNLSSKVRREIGKKVLEAGGNAVLGYSSHFDIEGTSSLVARAYGTACILLKSDTSQMIIQKSASLVVEDGNNDDNGKDKVLSEKADVHGNNCNDNSDNNNNNSSNINSENTWPLTMKNSSDFDNYIDISAMPPQGENAARGGSSSAAFLPPGSSVITLIKSVGSKDGIVSKSNSLQNIILADNCVIALQKNVNNMRVLLPLVAFGPKNELSTLSSGGIVSNLLYNLSNPGNIDIAREAAANSLLSNEIQILSLKSFERHARIRLGGLVTAKSVKFLGKLEATVSDQETREAWWEELRDEVKSHAKTMCCTHIVGYSETCTIYGEVCVLSAIGTAATVKSLAHPVSTIDSLSFQGGANVAMGGEGGLPPRSSREGFEEGLDYDRMEDEEEGGENVEQASERSSRSGAATATGTPFGSVKGGDDNSAAGGNPAASAAYLSPPGGASEANRLGSRSGYSGSGGAAKQHKTGMSLNFGSGRGADTSNTFTPISRDFLGFASAAGSGSSPRGSIPPHQLQGTRRVRRLPRPCSSVHVPYNHNMAPFSFMRLVPCLGCKRKWVPENILATIEPSFALEIRGQGHLLEARICRTRRCAPGESDAVKISEVLPFIEFDLQRQLMLKLKISGMNAAFGYCCRVQVGQSIVIATATCTAMYLEALPQPPPLQVNRVIKDGREDSRLQKLQQNLEELAMMNRGFLDQAAAIKQRSLGYGVSGEGSSGQLTSGDVSPKGDAKSSSVSPAAHSVEQDSDKGAALADREEAGGHGEAKLNQENLLKVSQYKAGALKSEAADAIAESSSSSSSSSSSTSSSDEGEESSLESPESSESSESSEDEEEDREKEANVAGSIKDSKDVASNPNLKDAAAAAKDVSFADAPSDRVAEAATASVDPSANATASDEPAGAAASKLNTRSSRKYSDVLQGDNPRSGKRISGKGVIPRVRRGVFRDDRPPVVLEIDDETDIDMMAVLSDWRSPYDDMRVVNLCSMPGSTDVYLSGGRNVTILLRSKINGNMYRNRQSGGRVDASGDLNHLFSKLFKDAYSRICFSVRTMMPCHILGLNHTCNVLDDDLAEVVVTAMVCQTMPAQPLPRPHAHLPELKSSTPPSSAGDASRLALSSSPSGDLSPASEAAGAIELRSLSRDSGSESTKSPALLGLTLPAESTPSSKDAQVERASYSPSSGSFLESLKERILSGSGATRDRVDSDSNKLNTPTRLSRRDILPLLHSASPYLVSDGVLLTPLSQVSGSTIERYLGPVQLLFIKDSWTGRLEGSFETFLYSLIAEANAVSRAHVAALGGNALLCHRLVPQESGGRTYRNMTYHMFSVTGDAVLLEHC